MKTLFLSLLFVASTWGQMVYPVSGNCEQGGQNVQIAQASVQSSSQVQASFPGCTVTVYAVGTTNLAQIFNSSGAAVANPFTADTVTGLWQFWAPQGLIDVMRSEGSLGGIPFTYTVTMLAGGTGTGISFLGTLTGTINGINPTFYLQQPETAIILQRNGQTLDPGVDYNLTGGYTVTFLPQSIPQPGDILAVYGANSLLFLGVPAGVINNTNTVFTISTQPGQLLLYKNGQALYYGLDYTLSSGTITLAVAPQVGDILIAYATAGGGNSGNGTVLPGVGGQFAYYATGGNTVQGKTLTTGTAIQKGDGMGGLTNALPNDFISALWLNIADYGASNSPSSCATDSAMDAANAAASLSMSPTIILFPAGVWYQCHTYNPVPNAQMMGVSQWAQEPEFGSVSGTVLKAGTTFTPGSTLQSNFQVFLGGNSGHDDYGSGVSHMHLDGSGLADGVYVGHVNESTTVKYVEALNYPRVGLMLCGADNGGACNYFGKSGENGAQVEGEFSDLIFSSNDSYGASSSTVAMYLVNLTGNRKIKNVTIVPVTGNSANIPATGVVFWGIKDALEGIHGQNMTRLLTVSPPVGSLCPAGCNGSINDTFTNLDLTQAPTPNYVVDIQAATDNTLMFTNVSSQGGSGATCLIRYNLSNGLNGCIIHQISRWDIDANGIPQSIEDGFTFNAPEVFNQVASFQGPANSFQWRSPGSPFSITNVTQANNGDWTMAGTGTSQNVLFARGFSTVGIYAGSPLSAINFNALLDTGNTGMRSSICNDIHWDTITQAWIVGNNGGGDFACLSFHNGFSGIATNNGYSPGASISQAAFNVQHALITLDNGHTIAGKGSVNAGGTLAVSDSGSSLQTIDTISTKLYTVSTLPATCNPPQQAAVLDAITPTYNGTLVGGGSTFTPVWCIGSNTWRSF